MKTIVTVACKRCVDQFSLVTEISGESRGDEANDGEEEEVDATKEQNDKWLKRESVVMMKERED